MSFQASAIERNVRRRLRNTTCITTVFAGVALLNAAPSSAQLLTLTGLANDLNILNTTVSDQGVKITANTNLTNALNTSVNSLTTTVNSQVTALQAVQAAATVNANSIATVTASVNQQQTLLTANSNLLNTVSTGLGGLGSTVTSQASALQGLQATVNGNVSDLAALSTTVNQQGLQLTARLGTLDTLSNGLTSLTNTVTGQGQAVQALQGGVAAVTSDVGALTGTVGGVLRDVAAATTQLAQQGTDLQTLQASVGANAADVVGLQATLGATGVDVTDLQTQVADHELRIVANTAQLGTLGATVTLQGAALTQQGGDLATAAANIASLQGLVSSQATTLGALGTTVTAQGALLGQQDTRITANADAILSLRNMAVSGNASPLQYTTPADPTVATTVATNDVAVLGAQPGPVRIHNVGDGQVAANSTDAVNGGQLFAMGQQVDGLAAVAVRYDDSTHARLTLGGIGATPAVIANVAPGSVAQGSSEAVNGGQLADTNALVAALRSDATVQARDLSVAQGDIAILGNTLSAQTVLLGTNAASISSLRSDVDNGAIGPVRYSDPATPVLPNGGTITQSLALVGRDPAPVSLHNVADGHLASGSTDAVNGGQLFALSEHYQGLADLALSYDDGSHASATLGAAGAPVALRNIAAGTLAAGSNDAATTGQLFETNQNVTSLSNLAQLQGGTIGTLDTRLGDLSRDLGQLGLAVDTGSRGPIRYSDAGNPTAPNGGMLSQDLTLVGTGSGPVGLHNVADGIIAAGSFDAVNGNQLFLLGRNAANAMGPGFRYDSLTGFSGNFTFKGQSYGSVQSVFGAIETSLGTSAGNGPGTGGTAIDPDSIKYFHANSTMDDSDASGFDSTAIGPASTSSGVAAIAVGRNAVAGGDSSVAIGDGAAAINGKAVSIGLGNVASGDGAVAIGDPNYATGEGATALGKDNNATGVGAIALGNVNVAEGDGSTAIGSMNRSNGLGAAALGYTNIAAGKGAIAIGTHNSATGDGALAIGANVITNAADTLAIGNTASANGIRAVAIGNKATAAAINAAAFGYDAEATADYATAVGTIARADGFGGTALGTLSSATGYAASALGSGAIADKDGSVALGSASQTTRGAVSGYSAFGTSGSQQSLGEVAIARNLAYLDPVTNTYSPTGNRQITGVAAGAEDTDAVNVSQLRGVSGTLGAAYVTSFGGGARYDSSTGALAGPSYTLQGVTYSSVGDALQAINARLSRVVDAGEANAPANGSTGTAPVDNAESAVPLPPANPPTNNSGTAVAATSEQLAAATTQIAATTTRVAAVETRVSSVETKADQALAASSRSIQYDGDDEASITLGGEKAVALHNLAPGTADTDAVNVAQLNTAMNGAIDAANSYTDQRVAALSFDLGRVNRDLSAGVAGALAMAGMPQPYEEGKSMFSLGAGTFQGQSAVAMGVSRIMSDGHTIIKLGATYNSRKRMGANVGVGYQF
jgi:autotransporter adhesin